MVPSSKSIGHRAIIAASLSKGRSVITNVHMSEDIKATLECMKVLGTDYSYYEQNRSIYINGNDIRMKEFSNDIILDCNESGSTLRFLMPLALLTNKTVKFVGRGRLMSRPQKPYFDIFNEKRIQYIQNDESIILNGKLSSGEFVVQGDISSQFITGLLYTLPMLDGDSRIVITNELESKGYIDLTLDVLKEFGIEIENNSYKEFNIKGKQRCISMEYEIEGDYSNAAFFLVAKAIGNDIKCIGLKENSLQGDREIVNILNNIGCNMTIDAKDIPDLVPILTVLCCFCKGKSKIINAGRLRIKESDRLTAITTELNKLGAKIEEGPDYLKIEGVKQLSGGEVDAWNDHRIAMSLAVASTKCNGPVIINGKDAVNKSYPNFWNDFKKLIERK